MQAIRDFGRPAAEIGGSDTVEWEDQYATGMLLGVENTLKFRGHNVNEPDTGEQARCEPVRVGCEVFQESLYRMSRFVNHQTRAHGGQQSTEPESGQPAYACVPVLVVPGRAATLCYHAREQVAYRRS